MGVHDLMREVNIICFIAHNFTVEMKKFIPAGSSEHPKAEPGI